MDALSALLLNFQTLCKGRIGVKQYGFGNHHKRWDAPGGEAEQHYCSSAYSALACFKAGTSASASFHKPKKSS